MNQANEGAFARPASEQQPGDHVECAYAQSGLTKREWLAGMALAGLLADRDASEIAFTPSEASLIARGAVNVADAILNRLYPPPPPKQEESDE